MPYSFWCSFYTKSTEPLNSHPASPVLALLSHAHQREFLTIRLAHLTKWAARACHFQKIWQQDWRWGPQRILMGYSHFCELEMHSSNGNWWNCVGYQEPASFFPKAVDNEAQSASGAVPKINCCSWEAHFTLESDRQCASKVAKTKHLNKRISLGFQKKTNNLQPQKITWLRISEPSPILWRMHSQKSGPQLECPAAFRAALEALVPQSQSWRPLVGFRLASKELMDWNRCLHIQQTQQASQALDRLMDAGHRCAGFSGLTKQQQQQ